MNSFSCVESTCRNFKEIKKDFFKNYLNTIQIDFRFSKSHVSNASLCFIRFPP